MDFSTKAQKADADGRPVFTAHLFAVGGGSRDVAAVKVSGEPKSIGEFTPVRVTELVVTTWSMDTRSGMSFHAAKVEPTTTARATA